MERTEQLGVIVGRDWYDYLERFYKETSSSCAQLYYRTRYSVRV